MCQQQVNFTWVMLTNDLKYNDEEIQLSELRPGDQVYVAGNIGRTSKRTGFVLYYHHGLYLGKYLALNPESSDMKLIPIPRITDFGRANKDRPVIDTLGSFLGGKQTVFRRNYKNCELTVEYLLQRAQAYITEGYGRYHFMNNNCEHYATYLRTGIRESLQVPNLMLCFLPNNGRRLIIRSNSGHYDRSTKNVLKKRGSLFRQLKTSLGFTLHPGFSHSYLLLPEGYFSQEEYDNRQNIRSHDTIIPKPIKKDFIYELDNYYEKDPLEEPRGSFLVHEYNCPQEEDDNLQTSLIRSHATKPIQIYDYGDRFRQKLRRLSPRAEYECIFWTRCECVLTDEEEDILLCFEL